jgi:hypothetical protein
MKADLLILAKLNEGLVGGAIGAGIGGSIGAGIGAAIGGPIGGLTGGFKGARLGSKVGYVAGDVAPAATVGLGAAYALHKANKFRKRVKSRKHNHKTTKDSDRDK